MCSDTFRKGGSFGCCRIGVRRSPDTASTILAVANLRPHSRFWSRLFDTAGSRIASLRLAPRGSGDKVKPLNSRAPGPPHDVLPSGSENKVKRFCSSEAATNLEGETLERSRARLAANVLPCYDSHQAAAAISHRDAVGGMVKWASNSVMARRSHSYACSRRDHFWLGRSAAACTARVALDQNDFVKSLYSGTFSSACAKLCTDSSSGKTR